MQTLARPKPETIINSDPVRAHFRSDHYTRINQRRLEHLATLGLVRRGMRILELGAGIGDLTGFFLDRDCAVTLVEGRPDNIAIARDRFADHPHIDIHLRDLDHPADIRTPETSWDLVFAYGLLYHLERPAEAIRWMAHRAASLLILETCVTPARNAAINPLAEDSSFASQALRGNGCRPTRAWVHDQLTLHLPFVYSVCTQPNHDEFPLDWNNPAPSGAGLYRAIFVASRTPLDHHPLLLRGLPERHDPSP